MGNERVYNFSAGPSMLPLEVLERAGAEITNYQGSGMSVMEMSHRSKVFVKIFEDTKAKLRRLMNVPEEYEILFLQGGASTQFSMAPLNLIGKTGKADYAVTGNFSNIAYKEAQKYGQINLAASSADRNHTYIPAQEQLKLDPEASYFYYCANNTIYGTEWPYVPETNGVPIVCDMSSDILSRPVDVSKYGIIFAGAQKNMAPAGLTVVIIRKELAGHELPYTPLMMNYKTMIDKDSMYNTPPCWCIYMLGLVLDWLESKGGIPGMELVSAAARHFRTDGIISAGDQCPDPLHAAFYSSLIAVRGNCDRFYEYGSLPFPPVSRELQLYGHRVIITHGDRLSPDDFDLRSGDIFISGHTHVPMLSQEDGVVFCNPGSPSRPRSSSGPTAALLSEDGLLLFSLMDFSTIRAIRFSRS